MKVKEQKKCIIVKAIVFRNVFNIIMRWNLRRKTDQSYIFIVSSRASISKDMSPKEESASTSGGSGATCSAIPSWLHLFNLEESEVSEELEWVHEGAEDDEDEDEDEDEVEDRKTIEVLLGVDDASGEFCDDDFLPVAIVLPDSTTITLTVFALAREGSRVRGWVPVWG